MTNIVTPQQVKTFSAVVTSARADLTLETANNAVCLISHDKLPEGGLLKSLTATPRGSVPAAIQLQVLRSRDNGATLYVAKGGVQPVFTQANNVALPSFDFGYNDTSPMRLQANEELWVATTTSLPVGIVFNAEVESYETP